MNPWMLVWDSVRWWVPALLLMLAVTFTFGRRLGRREGRVRGEHIAPIAMRAQGLRTGVCPLCGTRMGERTAAAVGAVPTSEPVLDTDRRDRV
ncbi:MAG: hypothetical protein IRZ33_06135 [Alicyclobacillaceae bacterium]|nr:hypothetical protein [Alicyclobacillaceae bacterium]